MVVKSCVVFCGLMRNPKIFGESLRDILKIKKSDLIKNVILSTIKGKIDNYPELRKRLKKNKLILIEDRGLKDRGPGNVWAQMRSLDIGLKKCKSSFVLKMRLDIKINKSFLKNLFINKKTFEGKDGIPSTLKCGASMMPILLSHISLHNVQLHKSNT